MALTTKILMRMMMVKTRIFNNNLNKKHVEINS